MVYESVEEIMQKVRDLGLAIMEFEQHFELGMMTIMAAKQAMDETWQCK